MVSEERGRKDYIITPSLDDCRYDTPSAMYKRFDLTGRSFPKISASYALRLLKFQLSLRAISDWLPDTRMILTLQL